MVSFLLEITELERSLISEKSVELNSLNEAVTKTSLLSWQERSLLHRHEARLGAFRHSLSIHFQLTLVVDLLN